MLSPRNPAPKPQRVLASGADPSGSLIRQELEKALAAWPLPQKRPLWPTIQVKHPSSAAHPRSQTTTPGETSLTLSPPVIPFPGSQPSSCPKLTPASPRHGRAQDLSTNRGPQLRFLRHSPTLPCGAVHAHHGHRCTHPSSDPAAPHPSLPPPWASPQASGAHWPHTGSGRRDPDPRLPGPGAQNYRAPGLGRWPGRRYLLQGLVLLASQTPGPGRGARPEERRSWASKVWGQGRAA